MGDTLLGFPVEYVEMEESEQIGDIVFGSLDDHTAWPACAYIRYNLGCPNEEKWQAGEPCYGSEGCSLAEWGT